MKRIAILTLILIFALTGCTIEGDGPYSETKFLFDTVVNITIYKGDEGALQSAFNMCEQYEKLLSRTIESSDVSKINNSSGAPVAVSDQTAEVISDAIKFGNLSNGSFDITIFPASSLWNFKDGADTIPDKTVLAQAVKLIDYKNLSVDGNKITAANGAEIDLGGIAKGFIADKVAELLRNKGVTSAIINFGGNVVTIGRNKDNNAFNIGIRTPFSEDSDAVSAVVEAEDLSVVTSGTYERYFEKDGVIYHHILNPKTGWSVTNELNSVTIISPSSTTADALSTACFVLGSTAGMKLIESLEDTQAVFLLKSGEMKLSSGLSIDKSEKTPIISLKD